MNFLGTGSSLQSASCSQFFLNYNIGFIDFTAPNKLIESPNYIRLNPSSLDLSKAVTELLLSMNWTLISVIYGDYLFGTSVKEDFTTLTRENGILIECDQILPLAFNPSNSALAKTLSLEIATCLSSLSADINVIVLFTSGISFLSILDLLWRYEFLRDLTFVLASTSFNPIFHLYSYTNMQFPPSYLLGMYIFLFIKGTITVIPNIVDPAPIEQCFHKLTPDIISDPSFSGFWEIAFRCIYVPQNNSNSISTSIPICSETIEDRITPPQCFCSGNETLEQIPYSVSCF